MIDTGIYITYALIGICVVAILLFAVARIVSHPKAAKSALIGIAGLAVIGVIAYLLSTGADVNTTFADMEELTEDTSHYTGAGLMALYLLMGLAVLSILFNEVTRLFK